MYKEDFIDTVEINNSKLKFVFGIDSKDTVLADRCGFMLFEYISKGRGYYTINNKKIKFKQGDAFLFKPWEGVKVKSVSDSAERIFLGYIPHMRDSVSEVLDKKRKYSGAFCKESMFNLFEVLQYEKDLPKSIVHLLLSNLSLYIDKPFRQKIIDKKAEKLYNNKRVP